jgi:two-component system response regulator ChvI
VPDSNGTAGGKRRVYVVDDDALFRESLERNLADAGFVVTGFAEGTKALDHIAANGAPALIVLDWRMPGMTGIEVLRRLRETDPTTPVIFLTALSDQIYEEAALIGGAVDFVEKTRSFSILLRRIELALGAARSEARPQSARPDAPQPRATTIGPLDLAVETARAQWKGAHVDLTLSEFNIVRYLAERAGQDVRYREIYDLVRGKGFVAGTGMDGYRANVRTFIKRIRQKFREVDPDFDAIENYAGFGYRWSAAPDKPK